MGQIAVVTGAANGEGGNRGKSKGRPIERVTISLSPRTRRVPDFSFDCRVVQVDYPLLRTLT